MVEGHLPAGGSQDGLQWSEIQVELEESEPDQSIVNPTDYSSIEVRAGKSFYLGNTLDEKEMKAYASLLKDFPTCSHGYEQT